MELILVDGVRRQISELGELVRIADPGTHPLLTDGSVRELDFKFSADFQWIEAHLGGGLSFATNMQKFKSILKTKSRFVADIDVYAVEETSVHIGFQDTLCRRVAEDARRQVVVLNQPVHTADAETICEVVESHLESAGYAHLLDRDPD